MQHVRLTRMHPQNYCLFYHLKFATLLFLREFDGNSRRKMRIVKGPCLIDIGPNPFLSESRRRAHRI